MRGRIAVEALNQVRAMGVAGDGYCERFYMEHRAYLSGLLGAGKAVGVFSRLPPTGGVVMAACFVIAVERIGELSKSQGGARAQPRELK